MKKTIQINIAGVVFNIEEDAYDKLSNYLRSIQQYFASYEGNQEIVSDIEARIAEKFWIKDKADNTSQVITLEGVNDLIKSMGSVADFEAIEEEEDLKSSAFAAASSKSTGTADEKTGFGGQQTTTAGPKRLYRDVKRKALGGVLAGLAHYFNIDVVWMRIIFLFLFLGLPPLIDDLAPISGFIFLGYFVCWIVFPPSTNLVEDEKIKKFYRDNDNKVLSGVASGLAAYFGVDVTVIRLLFVLGVLFFGTGLLAYIILWIVAPKANTLTQKMEMKGEPVTLSNIETNIKENLKVDKNAPENALTKILLFPFRLIAVVIKGIGEILKNLGPVARVLAGIVVMIFALSVLVAVVISLAAFFGVVTGFEGNDFFDHTPFKVFAEDIHPMTGFFAFLATFTPFLALLLVGLILLTNRRIGTRNFWISLLGLWLAGLMGTGILATKYALNFKKKGKVEVIKNFALPTQTLVLDTYDNTDDDDDFEVKNRVSVNLTGYDGTDLKLEQRFEAQGRTKADAEKNARSVVYDVKQKDSVLIFNEDLLLSENARFRGQDLDMTLYIPYDKQFKVTRRFYYEVFNRWHNDNYEINDDDVDKYTFVMKRDSGMICRDCPKLSEEEREAIRDRNDHYDEDGNSFNMEVFQGKGQFEKKFDVRDFSKIDVGGAFIVTVRQGDSYSVSADSDDQENIDDLDMDVKGNTLEIEYRDKFSFGRRNERTRINITIPKLEGLDLSGASTAKIIGFKDKNQDVDISLTGAVKAAIDIDARKIDLNATGDANADLRGSADRVDIDATGACNIDAKKMDINQVNAEATGASRISLGKVKDLNSSRTSGASKISRE